MCESMCVGSLRMTFVPVEVPKVVPKQRITARKGLDLFQVGDRVFNCANDSVGSLYHKEPWTVVWVGFNNKQLLKPQENCVCPGYDCPYVLESETIIEDGKRVVGYVNDPCPQVVVPKTMKFNDLPDWCVFTPANIDRHVELIKINQDTVLWHSARSYGSRWNPILWSRNGDRSWGIYNNLADCTIIGNIKFW